jgi:predicted lipoprotein with Yx(FWY)xxD motif
MRARSFAASATIFAVVVIAAYVATSVGRPGLNAPAHAANLPSGIPTRFHPTRSLPTHTNPTTAGPTHVGPTRIRPTRINPSLIGPPLANPPTSPPASSMPATPSMSPPTPSTSPSPSNPTQSPTNSASRSATPPPAVAPPASATIVQLGLVNGKQVLVDQNNRTLYGFTSDSAGSSTCTGACATTWPPLAGPATAGNGVDKNNLATLTRSDGTVQVVYFGHPLYYFAGDTKPGDANGEGIGGTWFMLDAQGNWVK